MLRYHKTIFFPQKNKQKLIDLCNQFNRQKTFIKSNHALFNLQNRFDFMEVLEFLKDKIYFEYADIFEYYSENDIIQKVCYKIEYNQYKDLIIVLSNQKAIVTVYLNNKNDNHATLKKDLYVTR